MTADTAAQPLAPWSATLPGDWRLTRIDNVADVFFSNVDKHTIDDEEPVRLCNYVDVYNNASITRTIDFMEASAEPREIKRFQIQRGDVLSTKDSETPDDIAISALVDDDLPGVLCGYHLAMMRPRSKNLHGPFLAWVHASKQFRAQYEARAVGVTRFGLPQYAFRAARLPLPLIHEQKRIAAYLAASCASIDAAVADKRLQIQALDLVKTSIIETAVTQGLNARARYARVEQDWIGSLPEHWTATRIKRIVSQVDYGISVSTESEGKYPVLKMGNIQACEIVFTKMGYVDEVDRNLLLANNDLLYNRTNSPDQVGKAARFDLLLCMGPPLLQEKLDKIDAFQRTKQSLSDTDLESAKALIEIWIKENRIRTQLELLTFSEFADFLERIARDKLWEASKDKFEKLFDDFERYAVLSRRQISEALMDKIQRGETLTREEMVEAEKEWIGRYYLDRNESRVH